MCSFPSQPTINFNFPEACLGQPDYIPDYLPSVTLKQESPVKDEGKIFFMFYHFYITVHCSVHCVFLLPIAMHPLSELNLGGGGEVRHGP